MIKLFFLTFSALLALTGCEEKKAPMITLMGAYFPSWLLCFTLSIVLTLILRVVFVVIKIDDWIQYKVIFYVSLVFIFAFVFTFTFFD